MKINTIGVWVMRITLLTGGIVAGLLDKADMTWACFVGLVGAFLFLDTDED